MLTGKPFRQKVKITVTERIFRRKTMERIEKNMEPNKTL